MSRMADAGDSVKPVLEGQGSDVLSKQSFIIREPGAPDLDGSSSTMFILDLVRQRREKILRQKKDDLINQMALKKKREMEEAKRREWQGPAAKSPGSTLSVGFHTGFVGVEHLISNKNPQVAPKSPRIIKKVSLYTIMNHWPRVHMPF